MARGLTNSLGIRGTTTLAPVAYSGSYNDLTNSTLPSINSVKLVGNVLSSALGISYSDLLNKIKINNVELGTSTTSAQLHIQYSDIENAPADFDVLDGGDSGGGE